ncbi:major facilitator superfamily domain-containing protein [Phascolomyces articulosus]|uniref:Major facilitator superfamily domain-containing protein n=1 Tax=Phascolomyces articulosus TaxID=60185 RepID=A0AAD5KAS6_9FUNG|nr:major facilitator superfamily domain-containing protein [Phascolomyces articulosus]
MGFYQDTNITSGDFSWLGAIFYLGYLLFQIPNQYLLQRFSISKYLGTCVILWGVLLACTALAKNFHQLLILRFFQGFFEAAAYPCIQLLISTVYRRTEQVTLFGIMMCSNDFGIVIGGLIGFGFLNLNGIHGLSGWRWCMIILGSTTAIIGLITFIFLPDKAKSRWYRLTPAEMEIVEDRIRDNSVVENRVIKTEHIREALCEAPFYCYTLISFLAHLLNGCVTIFSTQIIKSMGFSSMESILLNIPIGVTTMVLITTTVYLSRRFKENNYIGAAMCFVAFIGVLLLTVIPEGGAMLVGIFCANIDCVSTIVLSSISNNVSGYTKKVFYNGTYLVAYCLGNFAGPLLILPEQAPRYLGGMAVYMAAMLISALLFLYARWAYVRDNNYRKQLKAEGKLPLSQASSSNQLEDLSDRQDLRFIYRP